MKRRFFIAGSAVVSFAPAGALAADTVTGRFVGNGKEAKLRFAGAYKRDGQSGKDAIVIVLSEKDQAASKNPRSDAEFGELGSAVTISLHSPGGELFEAQLIHPSFPQSPITAVGPVKGSDVKLAGNRVEGRFKTNGPVSMFEGKPYEVKFELDVTVGADLRTRKV
ncbi:MAG TPA: hypothetical protein VJR58_21910 [Vineibacter sp.]|nr:hypothetical protein [Vineibacter sp.]